MCRPNAAAKSSSVPNPHLYNCTIASRVHPSSPDCQRIYGWPAPGSVRCLQLLGRTWLAPIPESRDHPLHRPFLDKLISENGPAENPQEIILNSLPCKCLFLWDLSRHRFQPDCLLRPLDWILFAVHDSLVCTNLHCEAMTYLRGRSCQISRFHLHADEVRGPNWKRKS